jgi:hypothetical protein
LVDPSIDFQEEGYRFLKRITAIPQEKFNNSHEISIPHKIEAIQGKLNCEKPCLYNDSEVKKMTKELSKQHIY